MGGLEGNGEPRKVLGGECARLSAAHPEHSSDLIIQSDLKTPLTNEPGPPCLVGGCFSPALALQPPTPCQAAVERREISQGKITDSVQLLTLK